MKSGRASERKHPRFFSKLWNFEFRTCPRLGEGEKEALEAAISEKVDGIIIFPSSPQTLRPFIRRAARAHIPIVCVATDAPNSGRLGIVAVDTLASGSIAADLMGRFVAGRQGSIAITVFDMAITEHAEKYGAFESTLKSFYPNLQLLKPIEDHDVEKEAYRKCRKLFEDHSDLAGIYVTTEASIPVSAGCPEREPDRPSHHHHDGSFPRSRSGDTFRSGCCHDLSAPTGARTNGAPHVA